ncbi:MAG TPA: OB-fold domain-containing protein [Ilumatobacteraceae bacterium]
MTEALTATHVIEYTYTRSTGPIIGAFVTGLKDKKIRGVRAADGRVLVPPQEYDPQTSDELTELVDVADAGTVTTWSWNDRPRLGQPLDHPFAWALVKLDGADTGLLAAVDAGDASKMSTGMRVRARWRDERVGSITDLVCFEAENE